MDLEVLQSMDREISRSMVVKDLIDEKRNAGHFKGVDKTIGHKKDRNKRQISLNYEDNYYYYFSGKLIFTLPSNL